MATTAMADDKSAVANEQEEQQSSPEELTKFVSEASTQYRNKLVHVQA